MKQMKNTTNLLHSGLFHDPHLDVEKTLKQIVNAKDPITLMYGETYDKFGLTIDSLKYYFLLATLQQSIERDTERACEAIFVYGDVSTLRNKNISDIDAVKENLKTNKEVISTIIKTYNLPLKLNLMSDVVQTEPFKKKVTDLETMFSTDEKIRELLPRTVLKNRVTQEEQVNYLYTREEVALILDATIKLGPPREFFYDSIAQRVATLSNEQTPLGLYVKPTYPLGMDFSFFLTHREIEQLGLTPYKAGSNQLEANRILIGKTTKTELEDLLRKTSVAPSPLAAQPLFDFFMITELARRLIEKDNMPFVYEITDFIENSEKYLQRSLDQYFEYIIRPLNLEAMYVS